MIAEEARFTKMMETVDEIERFRFCGPSDDPDEQTAVVYGFKHLAKRFVGVARRIKNHAVQDALAEVDTDIANIFEAYDLNSSLQVVIDEIRHLAKHPDECQWGIRGDILVEPAVIEELKASAPARFDSIKIARLCEELNSSFAGSNYLACVLLLRALLNHVPPIFGQTSFSQVVAQSSRSVKELLRPLEEIARDVADHHTHSLIRHKECLPTRSQIEPFKPNIEVLLQEVTVKVSEV